jgi:hypothetical protein
LFLQFVIVGPAREDGVDSSLSQKEPLQFFACPSLAITGPLVHPVHSVDALPSTCCLKFILQLLLCALFFDFLDARIGLLPLG